jgi:hypothetical protein
MMTTEERKAEQVAAEYFAAQSHEVQAATISSNRLGDALRNSDPRTTAQSLAACLSMRVWETGVIYMPTIPSKRRVRTWPTLLGWLEEELFTTPDAVLRAVAGNHPDITEATEAATLLIEEMAERHRQTFLDLLADCPIPGRNTNLPGWRRLLISQEKLLNGPWKAVKTRMEELSIGTGKGGRPKKTAAHHAAVSGDPSLGVDRKPTDAKGRLIRSLRRLKDDPAACEKRGTTPERVNGAYQRLIRGLEPSVEAAKREAGIAKPKPAGGIGIKGPAEEVAPRVIRTLGKERAKALAEAILRLCL